MTTYFNDTVTCANCKQTSEHSILGSTNTFGWPDLDLRPPEMKRSTMHAWLMKCPHCHYLAPDISEVDGNMLLIEHNDYLNTLNQEDYPQLANWFLTRALLDVQDNPIEAGQYRLNAAWVCDDIPNLVLATSCRQLAAQCYILAKPYTNDEESLANGTLLVDILRRAGNFEQALSTCNELIEIGDIHEAIQKILVYEQQLIQQADQDAHQLSECLEA